MVRVFVDSFMRIWTIQEGFRSESENEAGYEFCSEEVWYFVFVVVFVLA